MAASTVAPGAQAERNQAFDSILIVHNTTKILEIDEQTLPFKAKLYEVDNTNPFFRYDRDQCILCGRCVEACQNLQVKETLSICWEDPPSRALGRRSTIYESSCVSCAGRTQLGMLELFRRMRTDNSRRGLAVAIDVLEAVGKAV
jgi:formate dehydrogenase major subunit